LNSKFSQKNKFSVVGYVTCNLIKRNLVFVLIDVLWSSNLLKLFWKQVLRLIFCCPWAPWFFVILAKALAEEFDSSLTSFFSWLFKNRSQSLIFFSDTMKICCSTFETDEFGISFINFSRIGILYIIRHKSFWKLFVFHRFLNRQLT
jgi:hypothetical protein